MVVLRPTFSLYTCVIDMSQSLIHSLPPHNDLTATTVVMTLHLLLSLSNIKQKLMTYAKPHTTVFHINQKCSRLLLSGTDVNYTLNFLALNSR